MFHRLFLLISAFSILLFVSSLFPNASLALLTLPQRHLHWLSAGPNEIKRKDYRLLRFTFL